MATGREALRALVAEEGAKAQKAAQAKMVERAVRRGANRAEAAQALQEAHQRHGGANLAYALTYEGFATERAAWDYITQFGL